MSDDVDRVLRKCFYETVLTVVAPNKNANRVWFRIFDGPCSRDREAEGSEVRRRRQGVMRQ